MLSSENRMLPLELIELQLGQIDLMLAMYPDDITLDETAQARINSLRDLTERALSHKTNIHPHVLLTLRLSIEEDTLNGKSLLLDIEFPFAQSGNGEPEDELADQPPPARIRVHQPSWLNRASYTQLSSGLSENDDLLESINHYQEAAKKQLALLRSPTAAKDQVAVGPLVRVWFYFPSISTRSKRDDFIIHAPSYQLTGFLYAGKPGLLCVEGRSQAIDDYMKFIKTESWGDIPAHHKKVSERHRENIDDRVFKDMTETTDMIGERRGQRANRGDMKAMEEWLVERGLGDAFAKVLM